MATQPEREGPADAQHELLALADELLEQATMLRTHWTDLHDAVRGEEGAGPAPRPKRAATEEQPNADPRRLMAVDMILAGRSRKQVHAFLRESYGEAEAAEVIADIYGGAASG